jgi:hypothetical protein
VPERCRLLRTRRHALVTVPRKERAISDENSDVRQAAIQEIARRWKEDPGTLPWLKKRAISDENPDVRQIVIQELGSF